MTNYKAETIAQADKALADMGLPKYSDVVEALRWLLSITPPKTVPMGNGEVPFPLVYPEAAQAARALLSKL
jgi:hypothetical protein